MSDPVAFECVAPDDHELDGSEERRRFLGTPRSLQLLERMPIILSLSRFLVLQLDAQLVLELDISSFIEAGERAPEFMGLRSRVHHLDEVGQHGVSQ